MCSKVWEARHGAQAREERLAVDRKDAHGAPLYESDDIITHLSEAFED